MKVLKNNKLHRGVVVFCLCDSKKALSLVWKLSALFKDQCQIAAPAQGGDFADHLTPSCCHCGDCLTSRSLWQRSFVWVIHAWEPVGDFSVGFDSVVSFWGSWEKLYHRWCEYLLVLWRREFHRVLMSTHQAFAMDLWRGLVSMESPGRGSRLDEPLGMLTSFLLSHNNWQYLDFIHKKYYFHSFCTSLECENSL